MKKMHFRLALTIMLLLGCFAEAYGQHFEYGQFDYEVLTDRTCAFVEVSSIKRRIEIGEDIVIPETVSYQNKSYVVTEINSGFYSAKSIHIPKSVKKISRMSRSDRCESITVDQNNPYFDSRDNCNAIIETASNTLIAGCKNSKIPSGVTSIGSNAFTNIPIVSITIPSSVKQIGEDAFARNKNLKHISIEPGLSSIGDECFLGCENLTSITLPSSISQIGFWAFNNCRKLSVTILSNIPLEMLEQALCDVEEIHVLAKYKDNYLEWGGCRAKIIADIKE